LVAIEAGRGLVEIDGRVEQARTVILLKAADLGREALLVFAEGDTQGPVIIGLLEPVAGAGPVARLDGGRLVVSAEREVVFECGEASITLTRAGKVLIRGTYVLSRSSGVNRIKGGSVQIN